MSKPGWFMCAAQVSRYESEGSAIAEERIKRIAALYSLEKDACYQPIDARVAL